MEQSVECRESNPSHKHVVIASNCYTDCAIANCASELAMRVFMHRRSRRDILTFLPHQVYPYLCHRFRLLSFPFLPPVFVVLAVTSVIARVGVCFRRLLFGVASVVGASLPTTYRDACVIVSPCFPQRRPGRFVPHSTHTYFPALSLTSLPFRF